MSGVQFLETLQQLGYPNIEKLDGQSCDWMFENEAIAPFAEWFCDNVRQTNLIDPKDLEEFNLLERSEEGVLEGDQLEEALQNLSSVEDEDLSEQKLQEDIEQLEEELQAAKHRKDILIQQRNKLSLHHTSVSDRLSKLDKVKAAIKSDYKRCLEQSQADNSKINTSLEELTKSVCDLTELYQETAAGTHETKPVPDAVFLSQLNLEPFYNTEEKFTQELTAFTKKQFFEGIAEMAGEGEGSRYEFLEISNPVNLLVRGEKEQVNMDDCKELARLQAIYPKSECERVNAIVQERSTQAACQYAEEKLRLMKQNPYPQDIKEISNKLQEIQNAQSTVHRDVVLLGEKEVPNLIKDSAMLQVTKILRGDYDLKIARQDYFTSNQDKVIEQLVLQRSRYEFLSMAYEIENKKHRDTHKLLWAARMLLDGNLKSMQDRQKMMSDSSLSPAKHQRSTVDSRDKFVSRLYSLLDRDQMNEKRQLFLTYTSLGEQADKLHHQVAALRAGLASTNSNQDDRLAVLESNLRACESMVYSGSSTVGGAPVLSPQPILDALTQLDGMLMKLEQAVMDVIKEVDVKKKTLKTDPLQATERELFVYFFNDPDRLRRAIDDVTARLQAMLVK